jgi:hypothetical protein
LCFLKPFPKNNGSEGKKGFQFSGSRRVYFIILYAKLTVKATFANSMKLYAHKNKGLLPK